MPLEGLRRHIIRVSNLFFIFKYALRSNFREEIVEEVVYKNDRKVKVELRQPVLCQYFFAIALETHSIRVNHFNGVKRYIFPYMFRILFLL